VKHGTCEITRESEGCYTLTVRNDSDSFEDSMAVTEQELLDIQECVNQMRMIGELDFNKPNQ
jgi:hypothetical protein